MNLFFSNIQVNARIVQSINLRKYGNSDISGIKQGLDKFIRISYNLLSCYSRNLKNDKLPPSHSQLDDLAIKFVLKKIK